jgi:16S rRNA (guanine527-N7)-methyltransferase
LLSKIQTAIDTLGLQLPNDAADKFGVLIDELEKWNRKVNLTAVRDRDDMITTHLLDSLTALPFLEGETVLDVGTGPGFPGLPLAIVEPERQFTLLDSNNKKIMFVQHVAGLLGLGNISAVKARGEDYAPGHGFDTVIARALAALPKLVEIAGHHVGENGVFVALKGRYPAAELEQVEFLESPWTYTVRELVVPGLGKGSRHAVLLRRINI